MTPIEQKINELQEQLNSIQTQLNTILSHYNSYINENQILNDIKAKLPITGFSFSLNDDDTVIVYIKYKQPIITLINDIEVVTGHQLKSSEYCLLNSRNFFNEIVNLLIDLSESKLEQNLQTLNNLAT